jgi:hypothetical protein
MNMLNNVHLICQQQKDQDGQTNYPLKEYRFGHQRMVPNSMPTTP